MQTDDYLFHRMSSCYTAGYGKRREKGRKKDGKKVNGGGRTRQGNEMPMASSGKNVICRIARRAALVPPFHPLHKGRQQTYDIGISDSGIHGCTPFLHKIPFPFLIRIMRHRSAPHAKSQTSLSTRKNDTCTFFQVKNLRFFA